MLSPVPSFSRHVHASLIRTRGRSTLFPPTPYRLRWSLKRTQVQMESGLLPKVSPEQAQANFRTAIEAGIIFVRDDTGTVCNGTCRYSTARHGTA